MLEKFYRLYKKNSFYIRYNFYAALTFSRRKANGHIVHCVHNFCKLNIVLMTHCKQHTCLGDVVPPQRFAGAELQSFVCRSYGEDVVILLNKVQIRGCPCSHVTKHHQYHTQQVLEQVLITNNPAVRLTCTELNQDPAHKGKGKDVPLHATWGSGGITPIIIKVGARWRCVVSLTPKPLYPREKRFWYSRINSTKSTGKVNEPSPKTQVGRVRQVVCA